MTCIGKTFPLYFFVFITINDRLNIFIFLFLYVLPLSLPACDVYNTILRPLNIFTDFFDICHKQMLIYNYIKVWQLSIEECVKYKQCLNSLRTALIPARLKSSVKTNSAGLFYIKLYYQYQHSGKTLSLNLLCRQRDLCSYYVFSRVSKSINLRIS